ncbi:MAG: DNA-protecting protein DprA [Bacteroidales bacterium]|nr:DNA-protecting protein DprA [Bacteroidales bacterium]
MENIDEERACLCALNRIFGFEPRIGLRLVETFGGASEVFRQTGKDLDEVLGAFSGSRYSRMITGSAFETASMELEKLAEDGCRFVGIGEDGYPGLLRECEDPPLGLYFKGTDPPEEVFGKHPQIAVIGTRNLTSYGREWCQRIVEAMSKSGNKPLIVSGLALGADVTAHKAALDFGLPTVAVMATGIESLYPPQNQVVGKKISSTEGCALVTDYPPGTGAVAVNFLRRNRIIAGACSATILVESKVKGGGMMTARLAYSYDRDVYAIPGRLDDPLSQGCNMLIRENIAQPVGDLSDLVERLGLGKTSVKLKEDFRQEVVRRYGGLPPEELEGILDVAMAVKGHRGISVDELCSRLKRPYKEVSRTVTTLECDGLVSVDLLQHCSANPGRI